MFSVNDAVDQAVVKPVAKAYVAVTPGFFRDGVHNFFSNWADLWTGINSVLQLQGAKAADSFTRFGLNTFMGFGGVLDIASEANIPRHREDFGQTLGRWGVPPGPYIVLPIMGPSTLRDSIVAPVDAEADPTAHISPARDRTLTRVLAGVTTRARLLNAEKLFSEIAIDKYSFARDVFLQKRRNEVFDGDESKEVYEKESPEADKAESGENTAKPAP